MHKISWDTARKLYELSEYDLSEIFPDINLGYDCRKSIITNFTASEVIEKIDEWEKTKDMDDMER